MVRVQCSQTGLISSCSPHERARGHSWTDCGWTWTGYDTGFIFTTTLYYYKVFLILDSVAKKRLVHCGNKYKISEVHFTTIGSSVPWPCVETCHVGLFVICFSELNVNIMNTRKYVGNNTLFTLLLTWTCLQGQCWGKS